MDTITITLERYTELIMKELVYDIHKETLSHDKYISDTERVLFEIPKGEE